MNPNVTLDDLANGVSSCERVQPLDPNVIAALSAAVTTQRTVNTISTPVVAKTIDNTTLGGGTTNEVEFTFTNNTAVTITYWFTALFNEAGDDADFGIPGESAFDYPAAQGSGNQPENGGSDLRVFNKQAIATGGMIIGDVQITTSSTGSQRSQRLVVITDSVSQDPCSSSRLAPLCPACPENSSDSEIRVIAFRCPLAVGGLMSFGYPVLAGESVTIRLRVIGIGVAQYRSIGGDCGCY